jgi:tartrate/fumarate subfamily iron-sulfur-dependent hydro-lyase alpha chain/tartrate/fumarate subfamily iron-sulfur-dependent hydro-lyase beta chain
MKIPAKEIASVTEELVQLANRHLPEDVLAKLSQTLEMEPSPTGRLILNLLLENSRIAKECRLPICQDTGIDVFFVEIGKCISIDGDLICAINQGVASGTRKGYLRCSVCDPITRKNTGDNTPAVVHVELTDRDDFVIECLPKGCGSENMSALFMLPPSAGMDGIIKTVVDTVIKAGPNPCPPGIIGVGIGGTMEKAAILSKKALLRPIGAPSPRDDLARLEARLLDEINSLGIGPQGLGGGATTLGVAIDAYPCHIASLPVAVNIQCHAARHKKAVWRAGKWTIDADAGSGHPVLKPGGGHPWPPCRDVRPSQADGAGVSEGKAIKIELPTTKEALSCLKAGDWVLLNGPLYTGRDQTHRRLAELLDQGQPLPVDLKGQVIYYTGPSPAPPGRIIGSAGPTTSYRMDAYTPRLLEQGVVATIGKGRRSHEVREAMKRHGAIYLATIGGAGAYLSGCITRCELVAFPELGPEAMYRLQVKNFPAIVINDAKGADLYSRIEIFRPEVSVCC